MAYSNIDKPSDYFNTVLYTGTGSTDTAITGVGFQPDWVWTKSRSNAYDHKLYDSVRGANIRLLSNSTAAETTQTEDIKSFDSDGFTLGNDGGINGSGITFASWNWLAGGTASSNTDGSITSNVSANTTAGFSIVSYSGNSSSATVGHGLGVAPKMIIIKHRNGVDDWTCYHSSLGSSQRIQLNNTGAASALSWGGDPTSSVFYLPGGGATAVNVTGGTYIAYCFADVKGFSKFGSYTGNANTNGTFVYTGFKPAFILMKRTDSASNWVIFDTDRDPFNLSFKKITANTSNAEDTSGGNEIDILSNGFKTKSTNTDTNASGGTYIYMAFAESPIVGSNLVPNNAR